MAARDCFAALAMTDFFRALTMPHVVMTGIAARRFTGGQSEFDVEANTVRRMIAELERRFPGLGHQIDEGMAVAIDGVIYQDAYQTQLDPDSEVVLIPKIGGG
jgi:molybdopterin converting factor small subunit